MNHAKNDAMATISRLPEEAIQEEIMYELYVEKKVNHAREQVFRGEYMSHDEAKKRLMQV